MGPSKTGSGSAARPPACQQHDEVGRVHVAVAVEAVAGAGRDLAQIARSPDAQQRHEVGPTDRAVAVEIARRARAEAGQIQIAQTSDALAVGGLIARGDEMLALHDVGSARLLYELAAEQGSAEAAAKMGMTYDPFYLESLGVLGYGGDPQSALCNGFYCTVPSFSFVDQQV